MTVTGLAGGGWPALDGLVGPGVLAAIAERAPQADEQGAIADASLADLVAGGYPGLAVPTDFGGREAGLEQCCAVQRALGAADPALAVALNMHLFSMGVMVEHWRRRRDSSWLMLEAIATQDRVVCSAFAEPGLGGALLRSGCRARPVPGGLVVDGVKAPCSLAARADLVCFQALDVTTDEIVVALVPTTAEGVGVARSWDALGMRASESDTIRLDACFVPDDLVFHRTPVGEDPDDIFAAGLVWFALTIAAVYLGLGGAALDLAASTLRDSRLAYSDATRADVAALQSGLGRLAGELMAADLACQAAARLLDDRRLSAPDLLPRALAVKHAATRLCPRLVGEAAELVGGRAYGRRSAQARLWRDSQAARFHPPANAAIEQALGRLLVGLPLDLELGDRAPAPQGAGV